MGVTKPINIRDSFRHYIIIIIIIIINRKWDWEWG
jgi:hypothetical protein